MKHLPEILRQRLDDIKSERKEHEECGCLKGMCACTI